MQLIDLLSPERVQIDAPARSKKRLLELANEKGVHFLPGISFHYQNAKVPYLRLAFGHLTAEQIENGIPILAQCIRETRTSNEPRDFDSLF